MFSRLLFILFFAGFCPLAHGQFTYLQDQSIPVEVDGKNINLAWAGGFNAAQFNTMDLDGDNRQDIVIFDRMANKLMTFVSNPDKTYRYAPEYEALFPPEVDQWLILRDFNHDGKKDIFTFNIFGISVFVNVTPPGGTLAWRQYGGSTCGDVGCPLLTIGYGGETTNLQVNQTDISGFQDLDNDGDLDILVAHFDGVGALQWHKNMSFENTGRYDSMPMVRVSEKWGDFEECNCGEYLYGRDSTCNIFNGRITHAAGKSIVAMDVDNDGDRDLLFSEETCDEIYYMQNIGTVDSAKMAAFTTYPPSVPIVNFEIFPAPYNEDLDLDGLADLVVGSNIYTRTSIFNNFQQSAWFYKNTGTQQLPNFTFVQNNFLQDQMIEVGDNSAPAFFDVDGDGDLDMFIGSFTSVRIVASIYYYENTGSVSQPAFKFITDDAAGISLFGFYNLKPQFADIDGNGTIDLLFTATSAQSGITSLFYFPNKSTNVLDLDISQPLSTNFDIGFDENVAVVDVNKDGFTDILLGKATGALQYWINNGPHGTFNYSLANASFLGLGTTTDRQNPVVSIGDLDADGKTDLILGNQRGTISIYSDFRGTNASPTAITQIIWDSFSQTYISKNLGGRVWPVVANIFSNDKPALVLGNLLGGLQVLKNDGSSDLPVDPVVSIYPNPTPQNKTFTIKSDRDITAQIITALGQKVSDEFLITAYQDYPLTPLGLAPGVYIVRFTLKSKTFARRFVIF